MSQQPEWKLLYATDYSALYEDTTGVYDPELSIAQTIDDADEEDIEATAAEVYRFPLDRCWMIPRDEVMRDVLLSAIAEHRAPEVIADIESQVTDWMLVSQNPERKDLPHPIDSYVPWFADHLESVASSIGSPVEDLAAALCSDKPQDLAFAYEAIGGHSGYDNFDSEPELLTATEFAEWPERGVRLDTDERIEFTNGYVECALWCGVMAYKHDDSCPCHEPSVNGDAYDADKCTCEAEMDSSSDSHDESDLVREALETLTRDAHEFYADNVTDLRASTLAMSQCGHDFWLTRNGHGAGFWDHGHIGKEADAALKRLTKASKPYGEQTLIEGANMKVEIL